MKKLLFDLRGNPGGVLEQAVDVSDVFVPKGSMVVYTRGRTATSAQEYYAPGDAPHFDQPLVVLVNRGSASASEIVAGAIQDHDRGVLVGQRTWGKGLVQSVYTLSYGAGLALTTARYYTPSGRWIQRDYRDLLAYVNPGDPDTNAETGEQAPHGEARSSTRTPAAWSMRRAASPRPHRQERPGLRLLQQLLARYAFFNFAVDWLSRHPKVAGDFTVTPEIGTSSSSSSKVGALLVGRGAEQGVRRGPNKTLVDLALSSRSSTRSSVGGGSTGLRLGRPADPRASPSSARRHASPVCQEEAGPRGQGRQLAVAFASRRDLPSAPARGSPEP
jgi:hypothetical protein